MMPEDKEQNIKEQTNDPKGEGGKKNPHHHWIHPTWLRVVLKTLMWIIIVVLLIPVLLYIPPVQTLVKNIACNVVEKSTGMHIGIDHFRLKWPLDVSLRNVHVVEASGDTMVYAKEVIADVKLAPLFKLDVDINKVELKDAGFRMMAPDSSMLLKVKANYIDIDDKSSVDIKTLDINLNKVILRGGDLSLNMDVWKKQTFPTDTAVTTPLCINLKDVQLEDFRFGMSMLPTIDTLSLATKSIVLRNGIIDLGKNLITADYLSTDEGSVTYITPTPEYIAEHPAPVDTTTSTAPPIVIKGDTVSVGDYRALYAVEGAKPMPGFDPSYLEVSNVNIVLNDFYNEASTIRLPITSIRATERSGLEITEGEGTIGVDSLGLSLREVFIRTLYSDISVSASVPFALMEMKPWAPFYAYASGSIGMPDIEAFMPAAKDYTSMVPARTPLNFKIDAEGSLDNVLIPALDLAMPGIISLNAEGSAKDILDYKKLSGQLSFAGNLGNPTLIDKILNLKDIHLPTLSITGKATANNQVFAADFDLKTSSGDLAADGRVSLTSENYGVKLNIHDFDVEDFMPDLGIGIVNATLMARGKGFNPTMNHASADIRLNLQSIYYNKNELNDITAVASLKDGLFDIMIDSPNEEARLKVDAKGSIAPDLYSIDLTAILANLDLQELGITPEDNEGHLTLTLTGNASPEKWLYDLHLMVRDVEWTVGNQFFDFPGSLNLDFKSTLDKVTADIYARQTDMDFESPTNLKHLIDSFVAVGDSVSKQIAKRDLNIEELQAKLPLFKLNVKAAGTGLVGDYLNAIGMSVDTIYAHFANDSIISGNVGAIGLASGTMRADTLTFALKQRGRLLDYKAHMGNRSNNPIGDFADVNVNGYLGMNRLMLGLWQKNQKHETGYRLGLTAAFQDSLVNVHFTPLKATIGYIPWQFNDDNFIEVNLHNFRVQADLLAKSTTSSILMKTQQGRNGNDELHLALDNIRIQDFLNLSVFAPPITASLNANLNVGYHDDWLYGNGTLGVNNFTYDKLRVGDFDLNFSAGLNDNGSTGARVGLKIDGKEAMAAKMLLAPDSMGVPEVKTLGLEITRLPLNIANAFLGPDILKLSGYLNGDFAMSGTMKDPKLNGWLSCDSVGVFIPMMGSTLKFNGDSITVKENVIDFQKFDVWGANNNPLEITGTVDASQLTSPVFNLGVNAHNFMLMNNDIRAHSDLYGKVLLDLNASARGPMEHFSVNANVNVLSATDVTYSIPQMTAQLSQHDAEGIVRFVNFNDTMQIHKVDTVKPALAMRIVAGLTLEPGMQVQVIYPGTTTTGTAKVEINPSGSLNYFQNYMGDMRLNGQIETGNGYARYSMPIVGEKKFVFDPESYVQFNGDIMNPAFHVSATDDVKASIIQNGNSRLVNFLVELNVAGTLSHPEIKFNLNTDDDITIKNELMSMSADQRSMAAINMLLTGQYTGQGMKTASNDLLSGTMYNLLTSQINGWLANNVHGVDLSLGVDQYQNSVNGEMGTSTSYSYTVSKSLFNNKFKISVGGNYTTDASADENFSENLISDISFEYILKQTSNVTMYARLFRHTGYESILEGEITETGVGFLLKRRLANLRDLFRWGSSSSSMPIMPPMVGPNAHRHDSISTQKDKDKITEKGDSTKVEKNMTDSLQLRKEEIHE